MDRTIVDSGHERAPHAVRLLILARMMLVLLCLVVVTITRGSEGRVGTALYILLFVYLGLNGLYLLILDHYRSRIAAFMTVQFAIDTVAISGLVFLTGGVHSNFINLFFLPIMTSSLMLSRRSSGFYASLATIGISMVAALYMVEAGLGIADGLMENLRANWGGQYTNAVMVRMLWLVVAFFVVAYLSGLLAKRLELARSLNEEILQNMAEGVAVFGPSGRLLFINHEFQKLFGRDRSIQLDDSAAGVFPDPEDDILRQLVVSRSSARFELSARVDDDFERPAMEIRTSLLGDSDDHSGMVMLAIDLSFRQRALEAERRAERFSAVTEMAAGLAHEIRNPLASVRGSIQEISRDFPEGSPNAILAGIVMKESDRLDRIITNFLQYARQRKPNGIPCKISGILNDVKTMLSTRPDATGIEFIFNAGNNEPEVVCDGDQLREVFLNFGVNAINAMGSRGTLEITYPDPSKRPPGTNIIPLGTDMDGVVISFRDSGPGMKKEIADRVFEPFFTTKAKGSGLGLAIARRVVDSHNGIIWAESKPGEGAVFCCWLPLSGPECGA